VLQIGGNPSLSNVVLANPQFKNPDAGDFALAAVPQGVRGDTGSFEFIG
jgi:hypothetical protein